MTGVGSSCGACKFLRRKCATECVFAPYFCYDQAATHFAAVHKVFGASNFSKLLLHLPIQCRNDAALTVSYEALARMRDPIYGCVAHIFALQQQVANLQEEIQLLGSHIANRAVGDDSYGGTLPLGGDEFQMHQDFVNWSCPSGASFAQSSCTSAVQNLGNQMHAQCPRPFNCEGVPVISSYHPEQLLEGVDKDVFACCSWLNNGKNIN